MGTEHGSLSNLVVMLLWIVFVKLCMVLSILPNSSVNVPVIVPVNTCASNLNRAIIDLDILLCIESSHS